LFSEKDPFLHIGQFVADKQVSQADGQIIQVGWKKNNPVNDISSFWKKAPGGHVLMVSQREFEMNLLSLQSIHSVLSGPEHVRQSVWHG